MTVSSIYDYGKARPSWDPSHHKWPRGSESRSQHSGVTLPGTPSRVARVYLPFLFVFFHFLPSQGEKAQQVPGELQDAPAVLWVFSGNGPCGMGHCLSASAQMRQNLGHINLHRMQKEKKFRLCSPPFLHLYLRLGNLLTPRRHKPPSCQCRTGNTSPVQRQAADTENVLKPPLLLPKTFKLFRALGPTPSKNTNTA